MGSEMCIRDSCWTCCPCCGRSVRRAPTVVCRIHAHRARATRGAWPRPRPRRIRLIARVGCWYAAKEPGRVPRDAVIGSSHTAVLVQASAKPHLMHLYEGCYGEVKVLGILLVRVQSRVYPAEHKRRALCAEARHRWLLATLCRACSDTTPIACSLRITGSFRASPGVCSTCICWL